MRARAHTHTHPMGQSAVPPAHPCWLQCECGWPDALALDFTCPFCYGTLFRAKFEASLFPGWGSIPAREGKVMLGEGCLPHGRRVTQPVMKVDGSDKPRSPLSSPAEQRAVLKRWRRSRDPWSQAWRGWHRRSRCTLRSEPGSRACPPFFWGLRPSPGSLLTFTFFPGFERGSGSLKSGRHTSPQPCTGTHWGIMTNRDSEAKSAETR